MAVKGNQIGSALVAARNGSQTELAELLDVYRPYLLAIANREFPIALAAKLGPSDLVQETILRGYNRFATFQGTTNEELAAWMRQILLRQITNNCQAYDREKRGIERECRAECDLAQQDQPTPSDECGRREQFERVRAALDHLSEQHRRAIQLRHEENLSFAEIGALLGLTVDGARKQWVRAVQNLQKELRIDSSSVLILPR